MTPLSLKTFVSYQFLNLTHMSITRDSIVVFTDDGDEQLLASTPNRSYWITIG